jgi:Ca2+-binding RTX toxin-like protein
MSLFAAFRRRSVAAAAAATRATAPVVQSLESRTMLTVLLFDTASTINQSYGDRVTAVAQNGYTYGSAGGFTPNVVVSTGPSANNMSHWGTGYGSLSGVVYPNVESRAEFTLTADAGFSVTLSSFDVASWAANNTITGVKVLDGQGNTLYAQSNVLIPGGSSTAKKTFSFPTPLKAQSLKIVIDATNLGLRAENIGIDNIVFGQTAAAPPPPPAFATLAADGTLTVNGSAGNDVVGLTAAGGVLTAKLGAATKTFATTAVKKIVVNGNDGADAITVGTGVTAPTTLKGGNGNDTITGGVANDLIDGGNNADVISGGGGTDAVDYAGRAQGVVVFLGDNYANDGAPGERDWVKTDVEDVLGSSGHDVVFGSAANNRLFGNAGNDYLLGNGGNDSLDGGAGDDELLGGLGDDSLTGGAGIDQLFGEDGNDKLYAKDGAIDLVDGGAGTDQAQRDPNDQVFAVESFIA